MLFYARWSSGKFLVCGHYKSLLLHLLIVSRYQDRLGCVHATDRSICCWTARLCEDHWRDWTPGLSCDTCLHVQTTFIPDRRWKRHPDRSDLFHRVVSGNSDCGYAVLSIGESTALHFPSPIHQQAHAFTLYAEIVQRLLCCVLFVRCDLLLPKAKLDIRHDSIFLGTRDQDESTTCTAGYRCGTLARHGTRPSSAASG